MGYGMKYAKGGFPFKSGETTDTDIDQKVKSTDYLMRTPNETTASDGAKEAYESGDATTLTNNEESKDKQRTKEVRFMNDESHTSVPTASDFINDAQNKKKASDNASNKKRSDAERAHEAKEDASGQPKK